MTKPYDAASERKRKKHRELEREVLLYLRDRNEAVKWDMLYVHFDPNRSEDIGPVLQELREGRYISVDQKKNVTITDLGLKRLEAAMF